MAANAISHTLVHISTRLFSKKPDSPIFSSFPPLAVAFCRSPLPCFSLEPSSGASPLLRKRWKQHFTALSASSSPDDGEAQSAVGLGQRDESVEYTEDSDAVTEVKPPRKPRIKLGEIMGILNKRAIEESEMQRPVPDLRTGDIVQIKLEVPENRKRLSVYKGIIISRQNAGIHTTIRIRRIIAGIGVEIVFPIYSPNIKEIKVVSHRKVRRARLYYLRDKLPRFSTFK